MKNSKKTSLIADISLFIVAMIWGSGFVATKHAIQDVSPMYMMSIRFIVTSILLCIIFNKKLKEINKKDIIAGAVIGIFMCGGFAAQTIGLQYTTAGKNAFLTGTNVVIVPFLYWLVKHKKPDIFNVAAAILCFIGIGMISLEGGFSINFGDALTLLCAVFFACQIVAIGYFAENHDPIILTILQMITAGVLSLLIAMIFETAPTSISTNGAASIIYLCLFNTLLAFLIQNIAQKYTSASHAAIILSLEAVFGSVFSVMLLGEEFTTKLLIGCVIIFVAIITAETKWEFLINKNINKEEKQCLEN